MLFRIELKGFVLFICVVCTDYTRTITELLLTCDSATSVVIILEYKYK